MNKGIYLDKKTNKWYINTKVKVGNSFRTCTIRGYNSKKEADNDYLCAIEEWKKQHNFCETSDIFESVVDEFLNYRKQKITNETLKKDKTYLSYFSPIFKNQPLSQIFNIHRLKVIYYDLVNSDLNDMKKYRIITIFNEFSEFCFLQKYINNEMYQDIKVLWQPTKVNRHIESSKRYIPENHIKALLSAIPSDNKDLVIFSLFVYLGARIGEFLGICIDSVDMENNKITIKRQLLTNGNLTEQLKTSTSYRTIPITTELTDLLREYIINNNLKQGRLFKLSHTDFRRKLRHYEEKANIPLYATHEFRHTKATNLARKCVNISEIVYCAKILGHTPSMFMNTYCKSLNDELEKKFL